MLNTDNPNIIRLVQVIGKQELSVKEMTIKGLGAILTTHLSKYKDILSATQRQLTWTHLKIIILTSKYLEIFHFIMQKWDLHHYEKRRVICRCNVHKQTEQQHELLYQ